MEPPPSSVPVVLAATDFSTTAEAALGWAVELARQQGARVELVHAVTLPPSMPGYVPTGGLDFEAAERRLKETAAGLREKGVEIDTYLAPGTPSQVIVDRAEKVSAKAIVIGTR